MGGATSVKRVVAIVIGVAVAAVVLVYSTSNSTKAGTVRGAMGLGTSQQVGVLERASNRETVVAALLGPNSARSGAAGSRVVLGKRGLYGRNGVGWGTSRPAEIFNGGDPSGLVTHIQWQRWGQGNATGYGLNAIFKPRGGYYGKLVRIQLRPYDLGRCSAKGPLAYRKLMVREPSRPGGPIGRWFSWAGLKTLCQLSFIADE